MSQQYDLYYSYNQSGEVMSSKATMPTGATWTANYVYQTTGVLDRARVIDPNGTLTQEHTYRRDQHGRLLTKVILDSAGHHLGRVQLTYRSTGSIARVEIKSAAALPFNWDPLVDK